MFQTVSWSFDSVLQFCIDYTWITYTPVLLVSIQLLFSHCVKYAEIWKFSDRIRIFQYFDRISDFGIFRHISRSVLLNIFSHNLDLHENMFYQGAKIICVWIYELINCKKIKSPKIRDAQNLMGLRYFDGNSFLDNGTSLAWLQKAMWSGFMHMHWYGHVMHKFVSTKRMQQFRKQLR